MPQNLPFGKQEGYNGIPEAKLQVTLNEVTTNESGGWGRRVNSYGEFKSMQKFPGSSVLIVSVCYALSSAVYLSWSWVLRCRSWRLSPGATPLPNHREQKLERRESETGRYCDWISVNTLLHIYMTLLGAKHFPVTTHSWRWSWTPQVQIPTLSHSSSVIWRNSFNPSGLQFPIYRMEGTWEKEVLIFIDPYYLPSD